MLVPGLGVGPTPVDGTGGLAEGATRDAGLEPSAPIEGLVGTVGHKIAMTTGGQGVPLSQVQPLARTTTGMPSQPPRAGGFGSDASIATETSIPPVAASDPAFGPSPKQGSDGAASAGQFDTSWNTYPPRRNQPCF